MANLEKTSLQVIIVKPFFINQYCILDLLLYIFIRNSKKIANLKQDDIVKTLAKKIGFICIRHSTAQNMTHEVAWSNALMYRRGRAEVGRG